MILVGRPEGRNCLEDLGVDGWIILKLIFKRWNEGMAWMDLTQHRDRWQAVVNAVMNFWFP
jgi:hypothetical protein